MQCGVHVKDEGSPGKCKMTVTAFGGAVEPYFLPLSIEGLNSIAILQCCPSLIQPAENDLRRLNAP